MHRLTFMRPRGESSGVISERVTFRDLSRALGKSTRSTGRSPTYRRRWKSLAPPPVTTKIQTLISQLMWTLSQWSPLDPVWRYYGKTVLVNGFLLSRSYLTSIPTNLTAGNSISFTPWLSRLFIDNRPGDYIFWKGDEERSKAIGVVQCVSAEERIANVRWEGDDVTEKVPLLELDPHGLGFTEATGGPETFGIHRGEFVLIHREGTTNSATLPIVPRIGEMEAWVGESLPMYIEDPQPTGWRSNMAKFGMDVLATGTAKQPLPRPDGAPRTEIRWFGQVVDVSPTLPPTIRLLIPSFIAQSRWKSSSCFTT